MINRLLPVIAVLSISIAGTACQSDMRGHNASVQPSTPDQAEMAQEGTKQYEFNKSHGLQDDMLNEGEANEDDAIREDPAIDIGK